MTTSDIAFGPLDAVRGAFSIGTDLLSFLPLWLRQLLVAVGLTILAAVGISWSLRRFLPWAGPALAHLVSGLLRLVAYLLVMVEYLPTRGLRFLRLRPPALFYAYGEVVGRGLAASESTVRTGLGILRHLRGTPQWLVVVALVFALGGWNQAQCGSGDPDCQRPIDEWRNTAADWFRHDDPDDGVACPDVAATPPAQPEAPAIAATCAPTPAPTG